MKQGAYQLCNRPGEVSELMHCPRTPNTTADLNLSFPENCRVPPLSQRNLNQQIRENHNQEKPKRMALKLMIQKQKEILPSNYHASIQRTRITVKERDGSAISTYQFSTNSMHNQCAQNIYNVFKPMTNKVPLNKLNS